MDVTEAEKPPLIGRFVALFEVLLCSDYFTQFAVGATLGPRVRNRFYGRLYVDLARNAAPIAAYAFDNAFTLVSARTGCVVVNPGIDLTAVCLK